MTHMTIDPDDARSAGRLIQWGLRARSRPAQEPEYQELIDRYTDRLPFRTLVKELALGLGIEVLEVDEHGLVLAPAPESVFAFRAADFRNSSSADDRLLDGLVQVAIAATVYPRARDLEDEATLARPPITVEEVDDHLRAISDALEEQARRTPDPVVSGTEGLYEAWRVYRARLAVVDTADGRKSARATRRIVEYGLERLREFGCFVREANGGGASYQPTWRYQVLVRQLAATRIHESVRRLLAREA